MDGGSIPPISTIPLSHAVGSCSARDFTDWRLMMAFAQERFLDADA